MDSLRRWALWVAVAAILLAVLACVGAGLSISPPPLGERIAALTSPGADLPDGIGPDELATLGEEGAFGEATDPPGLGIPYLVLPVGLLLLTVALMALPALIGHRATALVNGIVSLVGGLVATIAGFVMAIFAFVALTAMVTLFLAAPFGTLAYLAIFGFFDIWASAAVLGLVLVLQLAAVVFLVVAERRMLGNKRLVVFLLLALLLTFVTMVLHSIVPIILVSITDAVAALVTAIVGTVWALLLFVGGIIALLKQLNLARQAGGPLRQADESDSPLAT
ncbi:hypothetical protein [Microbacterium cremeum]|uniref:hypothetical protein n=1 Tax=Microbacterium cremeum TaxID=2782169 RepID=UPI001886D657|nr:hypothetical protein [Microbacterium cremeum]